MQGRAPCGQPCAAGDGCDGRAAHARRRGHGADAMGAATTGAARRRTVGPGGPALVDGPADARRAPGASGMEQAGRRLTAGGDGADLRAAGVGADPAGQQPAVVVVAAGGVGGGGAGGVGAGALLAGGGTPAAAPGAYRPASDIGEGRKDAAGRPAGASIRHGSPGLPSGRGRCGRVAGGGGGGEHGPGVGVGVAADDAGDDAGVAGAAPVLGAGGAGRRAGDGAAGRAGRGRRARRADAADQLCGGVLAGLCAGAGAGAGAAAAEGGAGRHGGLRRLWAGRAFFRRGGDRLGPEDELSRRRHRHVRQPQQLRHVCQSGAGDLPRAAGGAVPAGARRGRREADRGAGGGEAAGRAQPAGAGACACWRWRRCRAIRAAGCSASA